jgi:uncharacterized membrane protein
MNATKSLRISWPQLILGLVGLGISLYSIVVKQRIAAGADTGCGFSQTINCDVVIGSEKYGAFLGLPWGAWGAAYFVVVLLLSVNSAASTQTPRQIAAWQLAVATVGILTSIALTYISKAIIGAWCPVCMATHVTTTLLFIASLRSYFKVRRSEAGEQLAQAGTSPVDTPLS